MDVSVVISMHTLDRWDQIRQAVRSVEEQDTAAAEVILVVDRNDDLLLRAREAWPQHVVVPNDSGPGLSGARNTGTRLARSPVVAFLDDDARAERHWLTHLIKCLADPQALGAGGRVIPAWVSGRPTWFPEEFDWVVGCSYTGLPERRTARVRNPIGANMSIRREIVEQAGGFEVELGRGGHDHPLLSFVSADETELCLRAAEANPGAYFLYDPDAAVRHEVPASRATPRYFVRRCWAEGTAKAIITRRHPAGVALRTEQAYVRRVLPAGVARGVLATARDRDPWPAVRAGAIVLGLVATAIGYLFAGALLRLEARRSRHGAARNP